MPDLERSPAFPTRVRAPLAQIELDETYPGMWRFRLLPDGGLSDMVNLSRAKDAAATLVLARLNEAEESGAEAPGIAQIELGANTLLPAQDALPDESARPAEPVRP